MTYELDTTQFCESCGASLRKWKHSLTIGLIRTFIKFCKAIKAKGKNKIHLQSEVDLTKNEYNNFQKLHYFGLVAKSTERGCWVLTEMGENFVRGQISTQQFAISYRDRLVAREGKNVWIKDFYNKDNPKPFEVWQKDFSFSIIDGSVVEI